MTQATSTSVQNLSGSILENTLDFIHSEFRAYDTAIVTPGKIIGSVLLDTNIDETDDRYQEKAIADVLVIATDAYGSKVYTTTIIDGSYIINASTGKPNALCGKVRLEFTFPANHSLDNFNSADTDNVEVQFINIDAGNTIDLNLYRLNNCEVDSNLGYDITCYVNGNPFLLDNIG